MPSQSNNTVCSLGIIWHHMFAREHAAPFAPLFHTVCSLVWHHMLPCLAPYAPLLGTELGAEHYSQAVTPLRTNTA